jgi:hypothetical protein
MRHKVTVRGTDIELRGYIDGEATLRVTAKVMEGVGLVIASPAEDDFDPFAISEPDYPPTLDASADIVQAMWDSKESVGEFLARVSYMHFMQANVIRGERGRAERAEKELLSRELHHFETEQIIDRIKQYVKANEADGDGMVDASDILAFIGSTA